MTEVKYEIFCRKGGIIVFQVKNDNLQGSLNLRVPARSPTWREACGSLSGLGTRSQDPADRHEN